MSTKAISQSTYLPSVFDDFFKPWNEWFGNGNLPARTLTVPAVNVTEDPASYTVSLAVPGLKKDDFKIEIENNMLTISSEKEQKSENKDGKFTRQEYSYSSFSRSFSLPEDVKQESIEAKYEDGILGIRLPRREDAKKETASRKIAVR